MGTRGDGVERGIRCLEFRTGTGFAATSGVPALCHFGAYGSTNASYVSDTEMRCQAPVSASAGETSLHLQFTAEADAPLLLVEAAFILYDASEIAVGEAAPDAGPYDASTIVLLTGSFLDLGPLACQFGGFVSDRIENPTDYGLAPPAATIEPVAQPSRRNCRPVKKLMTRSASGTYQKMARLMPSCIPITVSTCAIAPGVPLVITEGNYLLMEEQDAPGTHWHAGRALLDEVWYVDMDDRLRIERLTRRHELHGHQQRASRRFRERR